MAVKLVCVCAFVHLYLMLCVLVEHMPLTTRLNKQWLVWHGIFVIYISKVSEIHTEMCTLDSVAYQLMLISVIQSVAISSSSWHLFVCFYCIPYHSARYLAVLCCSFHSACFCFLKVKVNFWSCSVITGSSWSPFSSLHSFLVLLMVDAFCLQCFDAVGWVAGTASGL